MVARLPVARILRVTGNSGDCIFHIENKNSEFITIIKSPITMWQLKKIRSRAGAASLPFQYGGFVNKANTLDSFSMLFSCLFSFPF